MVIGDNNFHNIIKKINLPCKNVYYINEKQIIEFFETPHKINNKYKICKYFILVNEIIGLEYIETFKYISNIYGLKIVIIIFIQHNNIKIDKRFLQVPIMPTILTYNEKDILNYYTDNYDRLKEINIKSGDENEYLFQNPTFDFEFPKLNETNIIKEQDNGWDMKRNIDINLFKMVDYTKVMGFISQDKFIREMYKVYKENNCLNLYIKYYANYLGADYLIERNRSMVSFVKMFLYAYTLEEKDGKSFYSLMNNDFRSGNANKISRYLTILRSVYDLIQIKCLMSYSGDVYRATYFKQELIDEIKPGKRMFNASLWSSSKKLDVAKKFLFIYKKNILLRTKIKEGSNIDIHLEKLSQFPSEEEILILPFCTFEIKGFNKVKEKDLEYYDLELIYCEEENRSNKIEDIKFQDIKA